MTPVDANHRGLIAHCKLPMPVTASACVPLFVGPADTHWVCASSLCCSLSDCCSACFAICPFHAAGVTASELGCPCGSCNKQHRTCMHCNQAASTLPHPCVACCLCHSGVGPWRIKGPLAARAANDWQSCWSVQVLGRHAGWLQVNLCATEGCSAS